MKKYLSLSALILLVLVLVIWYLPQFASLIPPALGETVGLITLPADTGSGPPAGEVNTGLDQTPGVQSQSSLLDETAPTSTPDISSPSCHRAAAGKPFDISIPDGTTMSPGTLYTKTWRLVNTGECTWMPNYAVTWQYGDDLGLIHEVALRTSVRPGESVDVSVDMSAPSRPGEYRSYWMLRSSDGQLFGIGPNSTSPFWSHIQVLQNKIATPTIPPTATATPVVHQTGKGFLLLDDHINLDTGVISSFEAIGSGEDEVDLGEYAEFDLMLKRTEEDELVMVPLNGARLTIFSTRTPRIEDCQKADFNLEPLALGDIPNKETYLCYSTSQGLPGYTLLLLIDEDVDTIFMEYLTWAIP